MTAAASAATLPAGTVIRGGSNSWHRGCHANGDPRCVTGFQAVIGKNGLATVSFTHGPAAYNALTTGRPWTEGWEATHPRKKVTLDGGKLVVPTDSMRTYKFSGCAIGRSCVGYQVFNAGCWSCDTHHFPAKAVIIPPSRASLLAGGSSKTPQR